MKGPRSELHEVVLWALFLSILTSLIASLFPLAPLAMVSVTMSLALTVFVLSRPEPPQEDLREKYGNYFDDNDTA